MEDKPEAQNGNKEPVQEVIEVDKDMNVEDGMFTSEAEEEKEMEKVKQAAKRRKMEQRAKKGNKRKEKPAEAPDDEATNTGRVSFGSNEVRVCDEANELIRRENLACATMIVTPPKAKAAKRVEVFTAALKHIISLLQTIDENFVLYEYDDTPKEEITKDKVILGSEDKPFPTNVTAIKKFFAGSQIQDTDKLFLDVRAGADKDIQELVSMGNSLLQDALDPDIPFSCNMNWHLKHLQVPWTEDCGWVIGHF